MFSCGRTCPFFRSYPQFRTSIFPSTSTAMTQRSKAPKVILFLATFLCPPLPIFLVEGVTRHLIFSVLLTVFGFQLLGIFYTLFYLWPYLTDSVPLSGQIVADEGNVVLITEDVLERGEVVGGSRVHAPQSTSALPPLSSPSTASTLSKQPSHPHSPQQGQSEEPPSYLDATAGASDTTPLLVAQAARNDHKIQS